MHLRLENFDGPLDLLLHLIKAHELNIFNIPIAMITEQYLGFLDQVPDLDFLTAGEYLATAAQLIEIKANLLIPILQNKAADPQKLDEIDPEDPRRLLVEQLLEFEALKKASEFLGTMNLLAQDIYPSNEYKRREEEFSQFERPIKGNPYDLIISLERVLLKYSNNVIPKVVVRAQKITIQHKMGAIKKLLENNSIITLTDIMIDCQTRYELIVAIMAMLELCKANHIYIEQQEIFAEIKVTRGEKFYEMTSNLQDVEQATT